MSGLNDLQLISDDESQEEKKPELIDFNSLRKLAVEDFESLRNKKALEEYELQINSLKIGFQQLETDKQELITRVSHLSADNQKLINQVDSLSQVNSNYYEQIGLLQQERVELRMEVDKLHTDSSVAIRERNMCSEDLVTQKIVATEDKKYLEDEVDRLLKSNEHLRETKDRKVEKLVIEKRAITSCIDTLNEQLKEKVWKAQKANRDRDQLRRENKEMEQRIGQLVQGNVQLRSEVKKSRESIGKLEQQNMDLQERVNDLEEWTPEPASRASVVSRSDQRRRPSTLATTPPARAETFADEVKWAFDVPRKSAIVQPKTYDALEEYLHLSAEAVKISFPMIEVSIDELLRKAHNQPFYRVHDILNRYMMEKLQWEEAQERKKIEKCKNVRVDRQSRSMFTKVRGLFVRARKNPADRIRSLSADTGFHHVVQFAPNEVPEPLESDREWNDNDLEIRPSRPSHSS